MIILLFLCSTASFAKIKRELFVVCFFNDQFTLRKLFKYLFMGLVICCSFIKGTDFPTGVSYTLNVALKLDTMQHAVKVYLLPRSMDCLYFFNEATTGKLLYKQEISSDSVRFERITARALQLVVETENGDTELYNFKYNNLTKSYQLEKCNCFNRLSDKMFIMHHFYKMFFIFSTQLLLVLILDFFLFRKSDSLKKNWIISLILVFLGTCVIYHPLIKMLVV